MNELEESFHELINILVKDEATIENCTDGTSGRGFNFYSEGQGCRTRKEKKGEMFSTTASTSSVPVTPLGGGKGKRKRVRQPRIPNDVCIYCQEKGHWKRECPKLLSNEGINL
ncbi:UNVERIFIED_CONTAM: hypothetical protein Sangu_2707300 [Sesamum angustifolium]|uniref:CCHC-type domain-containing protein n=1 Tax=Sesamum angustifolium TaxID=2727405 RepID=A0AAW2IY20_9LAMI